jgi:hypothetical protein
VALAAAVVPPLLASRDAALTVHPMTVLTEDDALERVDTVGLRALSRVEPGLRANEASVVRRLIDDRFVVAGALVQTPLLDHEAEVEAATAKDVIDRVSGPRFLDEVVGAVGLADPPETTDGANCIQLVGVGAASGRGASGVHRADPWAGRASPAGVTDPATATPAHRLSCGTQEGGRTLRLAGQTAELYVSNSLYNVYKSRVQPR